MLSVFPEYCLCACFLTCSSDFDINIPAIPYLCVQQLASGGSSDAVETVSAEQVLDKIKTKV